MAQDRWMTFDCFGTLIDWTSGFRTILKPLAGDRADALMAEYHRAERTLEAGTPHRRYREVLTLGMRQSAEAIGLDLAAADADSLVRRWGELPLYPDVPAAFAALRDAGWKIAMLTNCDDDLFAMTAARNPTLAPDLVVTAEQVGSYKPAFGHFARFEERTGVKRQDWVHAACSWHHDIEPARRYGIARVWVDRDRTGEDPAAATHVVPDVAGLAGLGL
jgi:2-haloacid dehalogenase